MGLGIAVEGFIIMMLSASSRIKHKPSGTKTLANAALQPSRRIFGPYYDQDLTSIVCGLDWI